MLALIEVFAHDRAIHPSESYTIDCVAAREDFAARVKSFQVVTVTAINEEGHKAGVICATPNPYNRREREAATKYQEKDPAWREYYF